MPTIKQKTAVNKIVENHGNVGKAMMEAGYDETTAKNPKNLTESKGYKEILAESGLTESFVVNNLVKDIIEKPTKRLGELTLAADILGMRKKGLVIEDKTEEEERLTPERREYLQDLAYVIERYEYARLGDQTSATITIPVRPRAAGSSSG